MIDDIPYVNPTRILKFFDHFVAKQRKIGETVFLEYGSISDYLSTIPESYKTDPLYSMEYHNGLLRMTQLLVNEGLLSPIGSEIGIQQRFRCNGFKYGDLIDYGYYDFLIYGFSAIRKNFLEAVRPVKLFNRDEDKYDIGTGFIVVDDNKLYFITARHCLPDKYLITIPAISLDGNNKPLQPKEIFIPTKEEIDLAIIEIVTNISVQVTDHGSSQVKSVSFPDKHFLLTVPEILDPVLTMGFPRIPGFIDPPIQVAETARISANLRSTTGEITGQGLFFLGGLKEHLLISARVKGGNSGGPVINRYGLVVGMITAAPLDNGSFDSLGYGVAISSTVIQDLLISLKGKGECKIDFKSLSFQMQDGGFILK